MTKRDYELIAEVLAEYVWSTPLESVPIIANIIHDLADVFASENERFDYEKFVMACQPEGTLL